MELTVRLAQIGGAYVHAKYVPRKAQRRLPTQSTKPRRTASSLASIRLRNNQDYLRYRQRCSLTSMGSGKRSPQYFAPAGSVGVRFGRKTIPITRVPHPTAR